MRVQLILAEFFGCTNGAVGLSCSHIPLGLDCNLLKGRSLTSPSFHFSGSSNHLKQHCKYLVFVDCLLSASTDSYGNGFNYGTQEVVPFYRHGTPTLHRPSLYQCPAFPDNSQLMFSKYLLTKRLNILHIGMGDISFPWDEISLYCPGWPQSHDVPVSLCCVTQERTQIMTTWHLGKIDTNLHLWIPTETIIHYVMEINTGRSIFYTET